MLHFNNILTDFHSPSPLDQERNNCFEILEMVYRQWNIVADVHKEVLFNCNINESKPLWIIESKSRELVWLYVSLDQILVTTTIKTVFRM